MSFMFTVVFRGRPTAVCSLEHQYNQVICGMTILIPLLFIIDSERDPGLGVVLAELALKGEHRGILDHMFLYLNV